jgi:hypothetical protein
MKKIFMLIALVFCLDGKGQTGNCNNLGFSNGSLTNWIGKWNNAGSSDDTTTGVTPEGYGNLTVSGFNSSGFNSMGYVHEICNGGIDPHVPINIIPSGQSYVIRLGNDSAYYNSIYGIPTHPFNHQTLSNTFLVDSSNYAITYWYAVVFSGSTPPHILTEQPYFCVKFYDATGSEIDSARNCINLFSRYWVGGYDSLTDPTGNYEFVYNNWTPVGVTLLPYIGQNITMTFETSDCALGGHFCYAYIYANCYSNLITKSNVLCAGGSTTLLGMPGMASYQWNGPVTGNTQNLTTSIPGTYYLTTTSIIGSYTNTAYYTLTQTTTTSPTVSIQVLNDTICAGSTATLTAIGANTYTWNNNATTNSISVSPTSDMTYSVIGIDTAIGCINNTSAVSQSIYIKTCTTAGINKLYLSSQVSIYPNPNNGSFVIEPSNATKQSMQVYDVNGKLVLSQTINGKTTIDASTLNEGVYNISLISNEGAVNKRVIILR